MSVASIYPDIAGEIWRYPARTLTQTKFPFWSAIILPTQGGGSLPANSTATVDIQPPADEVWYVVISCGGDTISDSSNIAPGYYSYDVTSVKSFGHAVGSERNPLVMPTILTNSLYAMLAVYNGGTVTRNFVYGYLGFKLSQPLWSPRRLDASAKPFKLKTDLPLPDPIKSLDKYKCLILGLDPNKPGDYALAVVLEEDTPLAVDPATGFIVERKSAYVLASTLADLIVQFKTGKLDYVKAGYKQYIDKWKSEGIDLGI